MNVLYNITKNLSHPVKVPRILCSSVRLKDSSALLSRLPKADSLFDANAVKRKFEGLTSQMHGGGVEFRDCQLVAGATPQKKDNSVDLQSQRILKKKGFEALTRWCSAHQEAAASCSGTNESCRSILQSLKDIRMVDIAAITWLQSCMSTFSCGQSLVIMSLLCDVLYQKARMLTSVKKCTVDEESSTTSDPGRTVEQSLISTILAFRQRVVSSENLDSQPLALLLSAIYGLHRISSKGFPFLGSLDTMERSVMEVPDIFFTVVFRQMQMAISKTATTQSESADSALNIEILLTFMLVFTQERRAEFCSREDQKVFSQVVDFLQRKITLCLKSNEKIRTATQSEEILGANEGDKRSGGDAELHEGTTLPDKALASSPKTSPLDCTFMNLISLQECAELMRNISFAKSSFRLCLLQYVCCFLQNPSKFNLEEIELLSGIFHTLENTEKTQGRWLTDYIIQQLPPLNLAMMASLLPYTQNPSAYLQRMGMTDDRIKSLNPEDSLKVLQVGSPFLSWHTQKQLILVSLDHTDRAILKGLLKSRTKPSAELHSEAIFGSKCSLTPHYVTLLSILIQKLPNMKSDPSGEENREEVLHWASVLMTSADWCKGIESEQPHDNSHGSSLSTTTREDDKDSSNTICYSLKALEIYVVYRDHYKLMEKHFNEPDACPQALFLSDETLLNHYVRCVFMSSSLQNKTDVIVVLASLLRYLEDRESKRQLMDRLIRFNDTTSSHSLARFIELLSEEATALSVYNPDLIRLFLKQSHLDPRRLADTDLYQTSRKQQHTPLHTVYLIRSIRYLLGSSEWKVPARSEEIRKAITSWLNQYFLRLGNERNEAEKNQGGLAADREEISQPREASLATSEEPVSAAYVIDTSQHPATRGASGGGSRLVGVDSLAENAADDEFVLTSTKVHSPSHPSDDLTSFIAEDDLEELLEVVYRTGSNIPPSMLREVTHRCQSRLSDKGRMLATEAGTGGHTNTTVSSSSSGVKTQKESASAPLLSHDEISFVDKHHLAGVIERSGYVPPAHFLTLVRSDVPLRLPLCRSYLEFLLGSCSLEIAGNVFTAFFIAVQRRRSRPELMDDLCIVTTAFETVLKRVSASMDAEESGDAPEELQKRAPTVLAQLTRVFIGHLFKTRRHAPVLFGSSGSGVVADNPSKEGILRGEVPHIVVRIPHGDGTEATASDVGDGKIKTPTNRRTLKGELEKVDGVLLRAFSFLSDELVREIALQFLQPLFPVFCGASEYLFTRVRGQMHHFSQKELILLASSYPPGADEVLKHMMKLDLRVTVDFGEFLRVAKTVPMQIMEKVTDAHLDSLSFAWCTRLLSALVARQGEVSDEFLARVLGRVLEDSNPSISDRNLFLFILQSYLPMPDHPQEGFHSPPHRSVERASPKASKKFSRPHNTGSEGNALRNETQESLVMTKYDRCAREKIIHRCLKSILSLEEITSIDSLIDLLSNSLPIAQNLIELAVMERAEKIVSEYLLSEATVDLAKLTKLVQLLHRHHLPIPSIGRIVKENFFDRKDFLERIAPCALSEGSPSVDGSHPRGAPAQATSIAHMVELAALVGGAKGGSSGAQQRGDDQTNYAFLEDVLKTLRSHFQGPSDQLLMLSALVDTMARHDLSPVYQLDSFTRDLCEGVLIESNRLSSSELAKLLQNISRLKKWDVIKHVDSRMGGASDAETFEEVFRAAYERADPHSRCVVVKAMCSDKDLFLKYEDYTMGFLRNDIHLLSHEDLEVLLVACLHMQNTTMVEEMIDAIGTRLLGMLDQCKRSTLVRLLQCHANFSIPDDPLLTRVLTLLEEQFVSRGEARLENSQLLTLLQSIAQLDLPVPTRLATSCFAKLEKQIDKLSHHQLAQAGLLAMELEMGYSTSVHALVVRILENREGYRSSKFFREVSEKLCDEYDVEVPMLLRAAKLRARRERERLEEYWNQRRSLAQI
ncbi:unnamed protein product [Phytomonas sp. EM1]|nr:unnamed protein product [Phytomonas sp. EM1]|eukprot:CCW63294.1 unnamed protein product [Phytomonas sp. isolate EM1]